MNTTLLIIYIAGIAIAYFCFVVFTDVTDYDGENEPLAFFGSVFWPIIVACGIFYLPFYMIRKFGIKVRKFIHVKKYNPLNETYKSSNIQ